MRNARNCLLFGAAVTFAVCTTAASAADDVGVDAMTPSDTVVLLHGLGRSSWSMWILQRRLERAGLRVENIGYPSRSRSIEELAQYLHERLSPQAVGGEGRLHFVTHSMGGIVARAYIGRYRPQTLGRVVMLSPPNRGSEIVDLLGDRWWFQALAGPAASDLGTVESSAPNRLGPADFELGVIMGSRSWNPIGSWILSGPDDGTVSVESSKLEGMADFTLVPASHTFIMADRDVADRALHFLRYGRFIAEEAAVGQAGNNVVSAGNL